MNRLQGEHSLIPGEIGRVYSNNLDVKSYNKRANELEWSDLRMVDSTFIALHPTLYFLEFIM